MIARRTNSFCTSFWRINAAFHPAYGTPHLCGSQEFFLRLRGFNMPPEIKQGSRCRNVTPLYGLPYGSKFKITNNDADPYGFTGCAGDRTSPRPSDGREAQ